jgi:hypothetical protein
LQEVQFERLISSDSDSFTVRVDQQNQGTAWHKLGGLTLEAGEWVSVLVEGTESGYANADAVALIPAGMMIVDNLDPDFTIERGDWGDCWNGDCGGVSYYEDFLYAAPGCTACQARFDFTAAVAGEYDVWTWWPQGDDRATDTPFIVSSESDSFTVEVDQRNQGSAWQWLGRLPLEAGETVSVAVQGTDTGYANADAVALTPAEH